MSPPALPPLSDHRQALIESLALIEGARRRLDSVKLSSPQYAPGMEPSAALALDQVFELIEHQLRLIDTYVSSMAVAHRREHPDDPSW